VVRRLGVIRSGLISRRRQARPVARPFIVLVLTALLAGISVLGALVGTRFDTRPLPSPLVVAGFLVGLTAAGLLNLEYFFRKEVDAIDQFEAALAPAVFFLPAPLVVCLAAAAKALSQAIRGVHPTRALFNVAQWSAAAAAACLTFGALRGTGPLDAGDLGPLTLAMVVVALVNQVALLTVIVLAQRPAIRGWLPRFTGALIRDTSMALVVNVGFGLLFVATYAWAPAAGPILLLTLVLLHVASRGYAVGRVEQARLRVVQRATSALTSPALPGSGFSTFCGEIGEGFDRDAVDLILMGSPDPAVHSWRRDPTNAAPDAQVGEMLDALMSVQRPVHVDASRPGDELAGLLARAGRTDCTVAPVQVAEKRIGFLCLYDARAAIAFPDGELEVMATLAHEVGLAVENASLVTAMINERHMLAQIVNETHDGIATLSSDGVVRAWNPAFERLTGFSSLEAIGSDGLDLLGPVDVKGDAVSLATWAGTAQDPPTELLVRTRAGARRWLSCSYARAYDDAGVTERLIITARDVSDLKQAEALLADQAAVLELIAESAPLAQSLGRLVTSIAAMRAGGRGAVLLLDPANSEGLRLVATSGIGAATLREIDAFRLTPMTSITGTAVLERRTVAVEDIQADTGWPQLRSAALGLELRSCWVVPIRASESDPVLGVLLLLGAHTATAVRRAAWNDVLERAARLAAIAVTRGEFETRLAHQASHDALTGLPNRVVFLDRCEHALRRRRRSEGNVVVLFLDLDRFKLVNDSRGHEVGDQLLIAVGERLRKAIRDIDTVARFGGDEFAILCEGITDSQHVQELAGRVQRALATPVSLPDGDLFVPASIGVAVLADEVDVATLVGNADAAMYRAKQLGGNRCEFFEPEMRTPTTFRLSFHGELDRALERDEFFMDYQPLVTLSNGEVRGVEALVRWRHPERGVLAPNDFLPLVETSGMIGPFGQRVLSLACGQAHQWQTDLAARGAPRVNINLSPLQFLQPDLAERIAEALDATSVSPELIGLEITESAIMENIGSTAKALRELKELGVALIIDDFGTGYSSLTHLKQFPVDELKVDQSFIAGLGSNDKDGAIVTAVIALAHSLGLTAVAEGVETADQYERLQALACDVGQGFYFGRPGAASTLFPTPRQPSSKDHLLRPA
jgi:diguanylate cyclase (GGDEF)-like protein/PAS domain S-box-containing protein